MSVRLGTSSSPHPAARDPATAAALSPAPVNPAAVPSLRHDYSPEQAAHWMRRHEGYVARARQGDIDVLFVGDSITESWSGRGAAAWERCFARLGAVQFGASGDRTQQVLWRLEHGELDGFSPKVVVLLIGANNLDAGLGDVSPTPANTPAQIVAGVRAIVGLILRAHLGARILLLGLLPRGEIGSLYRAAIPEINRDLSAFADGRRIFFLDAGSRFLPADGELPLESMPDRLHLSEHGYDLLASAIRPALDPLLSAP